MCPFWEALRDQCWWEMTGADLKDSFSNVHLVKSHSGEKQERGPSRSQSSLGGESGPFL